MDPLFGSCETDLGGGGGRGKPVIPPKPEGYGTLGRHKGESNGSLAEQNRLSFASQRPKSTEMLTDSGGCYAATTTNGSNPATRQSPRSPRAKPPAPPVPTNGSSSGNGVVVGGVMRPLPPPPLSLAESQGSVLAGLALDCPCPVLPSLGGGSGGSSIHHSSHHHSSGKQNYVDQQPQLSVWNPLIEPPQLFQTTMDVDLAAFDAGNVDLPEPLTSVPPPPSASSVMKPAPPPPTSSSSSSSSVNAFQSHSSLMNNRSSTTTIESSVIKPIGGKSVEPPRLPSVPPVATSLSLNLNMSLNSSSSNMDPLTRPLLPRNGQDSSSSSTSTNKTGPITNELNKLFVSSKSSTVDPLPPVRMEPRITTDLVRLEQNHTTSTRDSTAISTPTEPVKPNRVLPLKPFPATDPLQSHQQHQRSSVDRQSLESIHSNPSTMDTTDSPRSLPLSESTSSVNARNALNSAANNLMSNGRAVGISSGEGNNSNTDPTSTLKPAPAPPGPGVATGPAPPPPLLLPAPHPPPPPPPSSYMTIDIDPGAGNNANESGGGTGGGGGEKLLDFYPPNSFIPYSFHSECWHKEIPENETKWQMYKRRFIEGLFNCTAFCIRCLGPV